MMNRLEKYYEPHPQQILRRAHNTMLMLPPPPLVQEGHGSVNSSRARTWNGYNVSGGSKPKVRFYFFFHHRIGPIKNFYNKWSPECLTCALTIGSTLFCMHAYHSTPSTEFSPNILCTWQLIMYFLIKFLNEWQKCAKS